MDEYIGLDVSLKETAVSICRGGKRVWRGKCPSDLQTIAALIRERAPAAKRVVFETGPLSVWFFHALSAEELPAICIDARHAKAALDMAANKTDANDADGLAHLAEVGFYKAVRVKSVDSMLTRTLVAARTRLVRIGTALSNQVCGLMKTFGLVVPLVTGGKFERQVDALLMKAMGLTGVRRGKSCVTTVPDRKAPCPLDKVNRTFFGPIGYVAPAEAEANYYAEQKELDMAA